MRYNPTNKNNQDSFHFPEELIIDNFCGGGGASIGIELGMGKPVDHAVNHDPIAIAMHSLNHPHTKHWNESVWDIDPVEMTKDRPVGLAWFSPDCTHFSKAKGGKPVEKKIRGLAWIVLKWIGKVKPRVIMLENVEEFTSWGPLINGIPCKKRKGQEFKSFINAIKRHGYDVDHRELIAYEYGAPTTRKRFFLIARCDGQKIVWPQKTHGKPDSDQVKNGNLKPWHTASEIIDWSLPVPSIFGRKRPLVDNTMRRIFKGIKKFVIDDPKPFIVRIGQTGFGGDGMQYPLEMPLTTIVSKAEHCLVVPFITRHFSSSTGNRIDEPLRTIMPQGQGKSSLTCAFLAKHYTGVTGSSLNEPVHTITAKDHNALVVTRLQHENEVNAFILKYYGTNIGLSCDHPLHTITSKERFALVTVKGVNYRIVDIGMRMLQPHELYAAQGFPDFYKFKFDYNGKKLSKAEQVKKCGNSVPPQIVSALVKANFFENQTLRNKNDLSKNTLLNETRSIS